MTDYQSSSNNKVTESQENESVKKKDLTPVVKAKKRSFLWRLISYFVPEDMKLYRKNLMEDIIVPAVKKQLDEAFHSFINQGKAPPSSSSNASKVNYTASWQSGKTAAPSRRYSGTFAIDDIVVSTRREGEILIDKLNEVIAAYGSVSVADLCELCEYDSSYTDNKYGWKSLRGAEVVRVYDGYCLKLPTPIPLD